MDVGTTFEIGYAVAKGIPVVGYTADPREYVQRLPHSVDTESGLRIGMDDMVVEDFGRTDNLMVAVGVEALVEGFDEALGAASGAAGADGWWLITDEADAPYVS